jgi:hypothetical protein
VIPLYGVAEAVICLAMLAALLCLFYGPWQAVCTDISRQIIFERRDRLFDMALAGRLEFDSEAYRAARIALNRMLRLAHRLTWQEFAISACFIDRNRPKVPDWRNAITDLPPDVRNEIEELVRECSAMLIGMMVLKSFIVGPIVFVLIFVLACTKGTTWLLHTVTSQAQFGPLNEKIQSSSAELAESDMALAA